MIGNAPAAGDVDIKSTPELRVPAARRLGKPERFGDRLPTVAAAATLVMLLAMTIGTTVAVRTFIRGKSIERLQSAASSATVSADAEITRGLTDLLAVEGLFKATGTVEPVHFNAFAESIMGRGSSVRVLGFVRQVLPEGAAGFNQSMHDRGLVGYDMIERSANPEHSAVEHIFPRGRSEITLGADLRGVGAAGEALRRAAETGRTTAAGPDWQSEPDTGGDLLVFTPVYSPVPESSLVESSQRRLDGFATGVYNIEGFVSEFLESKDLSGASFRLVDVSEPGPGVELFPETAGDSSTSWPDGQRVSSVIAVAGREWELQFLGPEGFGLGALEREVWLIVMFAGVAITLVAVGSSYSVFASRRAVRSDLELMTTQLSVILDSALEGILLTDADRTVVWANQAFADAFGLGSFQALRGEDLVNLISSPGLAIDGRRRFVARVEAVADDERRTVASEDVIVTAPEPHTLSMTSVPVADESGIYLGRLWVFRDVTTERAAEEAKSEFVSMVSHELRTPLTSVIGFLDLAIDGAGGPVSPKTVGLLGTARSTPSGFSGSSTTSWRPHASRAGGLRSTWGRCLLTPWRASCSMRWRLSSGTVN